MTTEQTNVALFDRVKELERALDKERHEKRSWAENARERLAERDALSTKLSRLIEAAELLERLIDRVMGSDFDDVASLERNDPELVRFRAAIAEARKP